MQSVVSMGLHSRYLQKTSGSRRPVLNTKMDVLFTTGVGLFLFRPRSLQVALAQWKLPVIPWLSLIALGFQARAHYFPVC
jgi:hypothetical protein